MNPRQVDRFFSTLAREFDEPARVILTGAAAGSLMGNVRPSLDIDFGVFPLRKSKQVWRKFEAAAERTMRLTSIRADYAADIDRWGAVSLMDYGNHAHSYRRFGRLQVRVLDPGYWSIGKLTRYLEPDVRDMVAVFKRRRIHWEKLIRLWAMALRRSPHSTSAGWFRRHVEDFLRRSGRQIWGKSFEADVAVSRFLKLAGH